MDSLNLLDESSVELMAEWLQFGMWWLEKEQPHALLVEDSSDDRLYYSHYLRRGGIRVTEALNGQECLDKSIRFLPDIVLLDLNLPEMDAWDTFLCLKMEPKTKHIPVIIITDSAGVSSDLIGSDGLLTKPCTPESLGREILRVLLTDGERTAAKVLRRTGHQVAHAGRQFQELQRCLNDEEIQRLISKVGFNRLPD